MTAEQAEHDVADITELHILASQRLPEGATAQDAGAPQGPGREGHRLDPEDWDGFARAFHELADRCLARMRDARDLPWRPRPEGFAQAVALHDVEAPQDVSALFGEMTDTIMPTAVGSTHPRFFGWVNGSGLPQAAAAELVAAAMNSNCGGRDHGATDVERAVLRWMGDVAGMASDSFGILTTGTSQATIVALAAARTRLWGPDVRRRGVAAYPPVSVYVAEGGHSCVGKALEILGHGSDALRRVPLAGEHGRDGMDVAALERMIAADRAAGLAPLAVVGTAGSVNLGFYDPLDRLADLCAREDTWLHVDGAFGFWTLLADAPWRDLPAGIGRADSVATDFHKWMAVPYDCGACLIADGALQRETFSSRPEYLAPQEAGLGGGAVWFCDYGPELSRSFRALKVWATIKACGTARLGATVSDNCRQAAYMGELAAASPWLEPAAPVVSNVCCMFPRHGAAAAVAARLQLAGEAVFSTTMVDTPDGPREAIRAALVNHRTTRADIEHAVAAVEAEVEEAGRQAA